MSVESVQDSEVAGECNDTVDVVILWGVVPTTRRRHDPLRIELTVRHCFVVYLTVIRCPVGCPLESTTTSLSSSYYPSSSSSPFLLSPSLRARRGKKSRLMSAVYRRGTSMLYPVHAPGTGQHTSREKKSSALFDFRCLIPFLGEIYFGWP